MCLPRSCSEGSGAMFMPGMSVNTHGGSILIFSGAVSILLIEPVQPIS